MKNTPQPNTNSRTNQFAIFGISLLVAPLSALMSNTAIGGTIAATIISSPLMWGYQKNIARLFSNLQQSYQKNYIAPYNEGYLVAQPRHNKQIDPYKPWRLLIRDKTSDNALTSLEYVQTKEMAQALCHYRSGESGRILEPANLLTQEAKALYSTIVNTAKIQKTVPDQSIVTSIWRVDNMSTEPTQAAQFVAVREHCTAHGPASEFYPTPPASFTSANALKNRLKKDTLWDSRDYAAIDQPLEMLTPDIFAAWTHQGAQNKSPWQAIALPHNNSPAPKRWTAVRTITDSETQQTISEFYPPPPQTAEDFKTLQRKITGIQSIQETMKPLAKTQITNTLLETWRGQGVQHSQQLRTIAPHNIPDRQRQDFVHLAAESNTWQILQVHTNTWTAVHIQQFAHNLRYAALALPDDPDKPWTTTSPEPLIHALKAVNQLTQQHDNLMLHLKPPDPPHSPIPDRTRNSPPRAPHRSR